jgi:hypothetical protein
MTFLRALGFSLLALIAVTPLVSANPAPPPWIPKQKTDTDPPQMDPTTGQPLPPVREEPRRHTGPFRSCGSGMGAGLAGIGIAWGLMWVGTRYGSRWVKRAR